MKRDEQMMNAAERYAEEVRATFTGNDEEKYQEWLVTMNDFAAGWQEEDKSRWISVEDELPKEKGAYLFHFDDGQTRVEGYFPELHLSKCVTHWMPLPIPPQGKEE